MTLRKKSLPNPLPLPAVFLKCRSILLKVIRKKPMRRLTKLSQRNI
jgi:hypothetical protein